MKPVSIEQVRRLAKAAGARGCVVLVLDESGFACTTYGRDRSDCATMRAFGAALMQPVEQGALDPWAPR